ncbi:nucleoside-diphosphate kinase [Alkalicella caledoniensis]|uniref:Nucleoside diphosphate kinase n=1 Tax=Alkalicella caledoniensis TaxID=2731377 RepID=A0A7G9W458_ALKCA|nr:nucleoside-diphosphate kinase [Alkalicella caledoniensis]QNO13470.1 nucleoside-diphosphate kinase [Alkalicella caledoniensis]
MEKTFTMIKPDGVKRGLVGEIIKRFETKGFTITDLKMMSISPQLAKEHYKEHTEKPFFNDLVEFITSGPVVAMILEGEDCVSQVRTIVGSTDPQKATPGSIRADYATTVRFNVIHASDSLESAIRETSLFFEEQETLQTI